MRVMVVSNIFPPHVRGGYELGLLEVARAFLRAGHEVEVVTSSSIGMLEKRAPVTDVTVRPVFAPVLAFEADLAERLEGSPAWSRDRTDALGGVHAANVMALDLELQRFKPDRIWVGNPLGLGPVSLLETTLTAGVPVIVHLMDDIDRYLLGYRRPLHWLARMRRLKKQLTAVSCSTLVRDMNSVVGDYAEHVVVLNGVDFGAMTHQAQPGLHDGPLRFVYAGQVEPLKGIPHLIEGASRLAASGTAPFELDIIGPATTSYAASLADGLTSKGLDGCVRLLGRMERTELWHRLSTYDAAVLPLKLDEPFGYAWLEAAAAGLPVVVTRGRAVTENFPDSYPLFIDDRDDPLSVAAALGWCLSHRTALAPLGRALHAHLRQRCDTTTAVNPRYERVLASARPPRIATDRNTLLASLLTCDAFGTSCQGASAL